MTVEKLKLLFQKHLHDKNYQHREMSSEEFDKRAEQSFSRLTPELQTKILTVCLSKGITDEKDIYRFRFLAQTNLFFLCMVLEKYSDMTDHEYMWTDGVMHNTHEEICNDFFVRKDPAKKTFKEFASKENYHEQKERLLLVPRGGFKSSMNMADCVQWIICFPEVTILVLTGVLDLAKDFVGEIKSHFTLEEGGPNGLFIKKKSLRPRTMLDGTESLFQVLFPEHCIEKDDGKSYEYQTPAVSMVEKECTVFAASIEQNLAGWHVGIMKLDDVVTNENSQTVDRIININKQVSINAAMLHPYGFFDKIGTWYDACLVGDTTVTMADWSQKPIKDIRVGDEVIGWSPIFAGKRTDARAPRSRNQFVKTTVMRTSRNEDMPVNTYTFASGRSITATPDHRWWNRKGEYGSIGLGYRDAKYVRRAFIPSEKNPDAQWLSGIFDGEGMVQKQRDGYPSATIKISQTLHNPKVVDEIRVQLEKLGFDWWEHVTREKEKWNTKYDFAISGGWTARYKFLIELSPVRQEKISKSLFAQVTTSDDTLVSVNHAGIAPVYCIQTTTGNYLADGCCSHNCDTYGQDILNRKKFVEEGGSEAQFPMKIYIRPAWWQNAEARAQGKTSSEMGEGDYDYWFNIPENEHSLTFKFLQHKKKTDPWFAIKYLNDPTQLHTIKFPRELLVRRTIPAAMLPNTGMIVTCVDTAYSTKSWADYTVIMSALIYGGRFYIIDMKRGRYNEFELPAMIAATALQWKPRRICIEESVGVKWMGREAYREMDKLKVRVPIEWVSLGQGKKTKSKSEKAGPVYNYLGQGKLLFLNSCPSLDELYDELSKFGTAASLHDDIVDVLAILVNQFCAYAENEAKVSAAQDSYYDAKQQAAYNQVYNGRAVDQSHMAALEAAFPAHGEPMPTGAGLGSDYCDPLSDAGIFG